MKSIAKIALVIFALSVPLFAQYDLLSIPLIDSISTESNIVLPYDVTGDGIDDIVVGNDSRIKIFDITTNEMIWQCSSFEGSISDIEIADIEPDGDLDMMVGTLEPYYRHFYIVYDMDTENIYEWPDPMPGTCYNLHFNRIEGVPYVFMTSFGILKMNLQELTYDRLADYDLHYPMYYTDSLIYGTFDTEDDYSEYCGAYVMDIDLNDLIFQTLASCDMNHYTHFPRAFADFNDTPGIEFIHTAQCIWEEQTPDPVLHFCNSELEETDSIHYDSLSSVGYFLAGNFADNEYAELLALCSMVNAPTTSVNILFSGKGDILGIAQPGESITPGLTCNIDDDPYDELIVIKRTAIHIYDIEVITVDVDEPISIPSSITISAYPNPFNASTTISYDLPEKADISLEVYDVLGRKIETLISTTQPAGHHQAVWHAGDLPSGVYFYKLTTGEHTRTEKMVLMK